MGCHSNFRPPRRHPPTRSRHMGIQQACGRKVSDPPSAALRPRLPSVARRQSIQAVPGPRQEPGNPSRRLFSRGLHRQSIDIWGDGSVVRDFIFIGDVIDALIAAMRDIGSERVFNIASGQGRSVRDIIASVEAVLGTRYVALVLAAGAPAGRSVRAIPGAPPRRKPDEVRARALMVQGTASHVGKTVLVAALCRYFRRRGLRVAPFKAQNMALNARWPPDGGEIGWAQAMQAEAAGVRAERRHEPHPPQAPDRRLPGHRARPVWATLSARRLLPARGPLREAVELSYGRLARRHELIVIEGAGSPAEPNFLRRDLVNMAVARLADAPVVLVGDVDRGGVFASLVGTLEILPFEDRCRVAGFVLNRFRGDVGAAPPGPRVPGAAYPPAGAGRDAIPGRPPASRGGQRGARRAPDGRGRPAAAGRGPGGRCGWPSSGCPTSRTSPTSCRWTPIRAWR